MYIMHNNGSVRQNKYTHDNYYYENIALQLEYMYIDPFC